MVMFAFHAEVLVEVVIVVVAPSDGSVVTSVVEYNELGTGDVERAQVDASSTPTALEACHLKSTDF